MRHKLAIGGAYLGGQLHWGLGRKWAVEARVLKGEEDSTAGNVTGYAYGLRAYRYLRRPSRVRFFIGAEGAYTESQSTRDNYETDGYAAGAFMGTEIYVTSWLSVGIDAGPYFLSSKIRNGNTSESSVEAVFNSFMNVYFL